VTTFILSYRTQPGYTPTAETGAAWRGWFEQMGDQLVQLGQPTIAQGAIGNCNSDSTVLAGYSIISADDLDGALAVAKGCPVIDRDGGVEVGQLGEVPSM
jgi:hypothetical protein